MQKNQTIYIHFQNEFCSDFLGQIIIKLKNFHYLKYKNILFFLNHFLISKLFSYRN